MPQGIPQISSPAKSIWIDVAKTGMKMAPVIMTIPRR